MPQYRHSKHARRLLGEFEKERRKTVSFALLTFIVLMIATIACTEAVSSFNSLTGIRSEYDPEINAYRISDELAQAIKKTYPDADPELLDHLMRDV